jgi:hypothetical protein
MGNLFFPQLSTGALVQYPIRKARLARTIKNVLPDGSMILFADPAGARLVWQLVYTELSAFDIEALQAHFSACVGPYYAFTFIDPTDNMLVSSVDLTATAWQTSSLISVSLGQTDPYGGTAAIAAINTGQATQSITQTLNVPANYQYCFSLYAASHEPSELTLIRKGLTDEQNMVAAIGSGWTRIISSGQLNDSGTSLTVAITLAPGQQVNLYGLQLEPQVSPSRYRATAQSGGVYANAHWAVDQLTISADGPNLFSTSFSIETAP